MNVDRHHFERVWPWLCASIEFYGHTHDKEDLWHQIQLGNAWLFPLPHAAVVTSIHTHPTGLKECWAEVAGGDLREIAAWEPTLAKAHKELGCNRVIIRGRDGWKRVLKGYRNGGSILIKDL